MFNFLCSSHFPTKTAMLTVMFNINSSTTGRREYLKFLSC